MVASLGHHLTLQDSVLDETVGAFQLPTVESYLVLQFLLDQLQDLMLIVGDCDSQILELRHDWYQLNFSDALLCQSPQEGSMDENLRLAQIHS